MLGLPSLCVLSLVQYSLIRIVLAVPYLAARNITSSQVNVLRHVSSPITLHLPNITYLVEDSGIKYHVPDTLTTLYFYLGFPCKEAGMRSTINSARAYCEQHLEQGGDGPLPRSEDPFHEDLGYGAAIDIVSARPDHRLTWGMVKNAMDGLWEFLVVEGRYVESEFDICHGALDLVGRGTIREVPETEFARESRKTENGDPTVPTFA